MKPKHCVIMILAAGLLILPLPGLSAPEKNPWAAAEIKLSDSYLPLAAQDLIDIWHVDEDEVLEGALAGAQTGLTADAVNAAEAGAAFSRGFIARASLGGVQLTDQDGIRTSQFSLPRPSGPGRDIEPLVYMPWHLGISPDGSHLLLITAEGYADQEIDYFRLWVLDLEGHVENGLESPGLISAGWFSNETVSYIQFDPDDPLLSNGTLYFWNWQKQISSPVFGQ